MRQTFVSFAEPDSGFAHSLKRILIENQFEVTDASSSATVVESSIREALAVVVVLSLASITVPEVSYQWAFAIGSGVPVLPTLLQISESDLHPRLNTLQHLDFSDGDEPPWEALLEALRKIEARQRDFTLRTPSDAPQIVQLAAQALDDADPEVRGAALATVEDMDHPAAIELLAQALRHPTDQVRLGAALQLASRKDLRALPVLLDEIRSGSQETAPWMLAMGPESIPLLANAMQDLDPRVSSYAALALGQVGGLAAATALVESLSGKVLVERRLVLSALEDTAESLAIPVLIPAVKDPDREVRMAAMGALVKCANASILPALLPIFIEALGDEYDQVGIKACYGLEMSGEPEAIRALLHAAISIESDQVRAFCRSALKRLPADLSPLLREKVEECSPLELDRVFSFLSELNDEANIHLFIKGTKHANTSIRVSSVNGLEQSGGGAAVDALLECLNDESNLVRTRALAALSTINDCDCVPKLIQFLDDEDVGEAAAHILEKTATKEARRALRLWKDQRKK